MIFKELKRKFLARKRVFQFTKHLERTKRSILKYYAENPSTDPEVNQALEYLKNHKLGVFVAPFQEKYSPSSIHVSSENGLPFVQTRWGKLFFKRSQNPATIKLLLNGLYMEQDPESPHCYTDERFQIEEGEILADIGCAEGLFTLMNIQKLEKAYLFEQDEEWIEALQATFAPWKEKVVIIRKYVSDKNSETEVRLDHYFEHEHPTFYKIDVEGAEQQVLDGMGTHRPRKIALCTYHKQEDFEKYAQYFKEKGYHYYPNPGLMVFINSFQTIDPPFFRKGLIKAVFNSA
jgi:hypothetical protein